MTYKVGYTDWIQVGGVFCVSQIRQSGAELVVKTLSTVVVPLQVEQVSDRMNSCDKTQRRHVTAALCSFVFVCKKKKSVKSVFNKLIKGNSSSFLSFKYLQSLV